MLLESGYTMCEWEKIEQGTKEKTFDIARMSFLN